MYARKLRRRYHPGFFLSTRLLWCSASDGSSVAAALRAARDRCCSLAELARPTGARLQPAPLIGLARTCRIREFLLVRRQEFPEPALVDRLHESFMGRNSALSQQRV